MRVIHIASEYPPTQVFGLGRAVRDLAVATAGLGHEVHVVTNSIGGRDKDVVWDGVHVHRISFPPPPKPPDGVTAVLQFDVLSLQTAVEVIDRVGAPDVVHVHDWLTALPGRVLKWHHPEARLVVTIHDTAVGKHFGELDAPQRFVADLERWIGQECDAAICCSQHVREELASTYGVDAAKIAIVPCGVDAEQFEVEGDLATFRGTFAQPDERIVLYVGRLDKEKGIQHLIEALAKVLVVEPRAKLVLAGKGALQEAIQEHVGRLGIGGSVLFAGYLAGNVLAGLYRCADVLAVPSLYEPFGMVALESMACGTPVIATAVGGLAEIIEHEATGLLVPSGDPQALAVALLRVLSDGDLSRRVSEAAARAVKERYTWGGLAQRTVAVYEGESG